MTEDKTLTTASGIPVADNQNSLTAGERGLILMQDFYLLSRCSTLPSRCKLSAIARQSTKVSGDALSTGWRNGTG